MIGSIFTFAFSGFICFIPIHNGWPFIFYVFCKYTKPIYPFLNKIFSPCHYDMYKKCYTLNASCAVMMYPVFCIMTLPLHGWITVEKTLTINIAINQPNSQSKHTTPPRTTVNRCGITLVTFNCNFPVGVCNLLALLMWVCLVYDRPDEHPRITWKERALINYKRRDSTLEKVLPHPKNLLPKLTKLNLSHICLHWIMMITLKCYRK